MDDHEVGEDLPAPPQPPIKPRQDADGKFSFSQIFTYLRWKKCPEGASKADKNSLRTRAKYFRLRDEDLYYVGGGKLRASTCKNNIIIVGT